MRLGVAIQLLLIERRGLLQHSAEHLGRKRSPDRCRPGSDGRTDGAITERSESGRRPGRSRGSRRHLCARSHRTTAESPCEADRVRHTRIGPQAAQPSCAAAGTPAAAFAALVFRRLHPQRFFASGAQRRRTTPAIPGKDGGGKDFFSETHRPEDFENRSHPGQEPCFVNSLKPASQPLSHTHNGLAEKGKRRLGNSPAPFDQRRTVEGSGKRSASLSFGNAFSHEQCSTKRRSNAWQRASRL